MRRSPHLSGRVAWLAASRLERGISVGTGPLGTLGASTSPPGRNGNNETTNSGSRTGGHRMYRAHGRGADGRPGHRGPGQPPGRRAPGGPGPGLPPNGKVTVFNGTTEVCEFTVLFVGGHCSPTSSQLSPGTYTL